MNSRWTEKEFAQKIDWEGGPEEALRWGLTADMLEDRDSELAKAWAEFEKVRPLLELIGELVEEALEDGDEEDE